MGELFDDFYEVCDYNTLDDWAGELENIYSLFFSSADLEESFLKGINLRYKGEAL